MTIFYKFEGKLYVNITNGCPCRCIFCIRDNADSIRDNDSLWLEHEPSFEEICSAFDAFDKTGMTDVVFCGYGEPTVRAEMVVRVAKYIKDNSDMRIRLNTNGLVKLIHPDFDISSFGGVIDSVSVSLNAPNSERYNEVSRPSFGEKSFDVMLDFAKEMKSVCGNVAFTVVDVISKEEIAECRSIADDLEIPLRVRAYVTDNESYT